MKSNQLTNMENMRHVGKLLGMEAWQRITAKISNTAFVMLQLLLSYFFAKQKKRILFSDKQEWQSLIKKGFRFTPHEVYFDQFTCKNIKQFDLVVPLTISDLKYLNTKCNSIKHNPIPIPSTKVVQLCDDKYLFNQYLIDNGFGDFIPKMGVNQTYPYILKKRIGEWGENCHIISNAQQEQEIAEILNHPQYFTQQIIAGPAEYATHILFKDQRIIYALNIKYVFKKDIPIKGKDCAISEKISHCRYLELFTSILKSIGFEGICCINYKVCDNRPFIIEINPRFGGSLCPYFFSFLRFVR